MSESTQGQPGKPRTRRAVPLLTSLAVVSGTVVGITTPASAVSRPCAAPAFAPFVTTGSLGMPMAMESADLNGDAVADLVTNNFMSSGLSISFGNGDGTFTRGADALTGPGMVTDLVAADVDNDGDQDLAVVGDTGFKVVRNDGQGGFSGVSTHSASNLYRLAAADLNLDGMADLTGISSQGDVSILLSSGIGFRPVAVVPAVGSFLVDVKIGDVDNDNLPDVVVVDRGSSAGTGKVVVLRGSGPGPFGPVFFTAVPGVPGLASLAHLDADANLDLVVAEDRGPGARVLTGLGEGHFAVSDPIAAGDVSAGVAAADLTEDGRTDVVLVNTGPDSAVRVLPGSARGGLEAADGSFATGPNRGDVAVADFTKDGKPDIAVLSAASGVALLVNTCAPANTAPEPPTGVTVVGGNAKATVSWTPAGDGGSAITGYEVQAQDAGGNPVGTPVLVGADKTSADVPGLAYGRAYRFVVSARNAVGLSVASLPSDGVVLLTVPSAPRNVAAERRNGTAHVTWTAPESDGGAPVTGYAVVASPGGRTVLVPRDALSADVDGLDSGTAYTFTVTASNLAGAGQPGVSPALPAVPAA
ncbi:FG-GAP-like repeat-containing protein, partial [Motilibacter deserti]|nr:hypothetical protein [Motilibacter deserti]